MFSCKSGKFQGSPAIVETARLLKGTQQTPEAKPLFWPQQRVAHPPFATLSDPLDISIAYDRFVHFLTQNYLHIYIYTHTCVFQDIRKKAQRRACRRTAGVQIGGGAAIFSKFFHQLYLPSTSSLAALPANSQPVIVFSERI